MSTIHFLQPDSNSDRARVAAEVRGYLAKSKVPVYKLGDYLDSEESRGYWQRRVSGEIAFNIDDLSKLATLLGVSISDFLVNEMPKPSGPIAAGNGVERRPSD